MDPLQLYWGVAVVVRSRREGRRRVPLLGAVVLVVCGVAGAVVVPALLGGFASAGSLPRGELVVATLPAKPAAVDRAAIGKELAAIRSAVKAPELASSSCLDALARRSADAVAAGVGATNVSVPTSPACGPGVQTGWVRGTDPTGVTQLKSALTRGTSGQSALAAAASKHLGLAVVAMPGSEGTVSGYVLAWAVSG